MAEDPTVEDVEWDSVSSDPSDLGVVVSDLPTNGVVHHRTQAVYQGGEKGPFSVIQSFSTPVAERPSKLSQDRMMISRVSDCIVNKRRKYFLYRNKPKYYMYGREGLSSFMIRIKVFIKIQYPKNWPKLKKKFNISYSFIFKGN